MNKLQGILLVVVTGLCVGFSWPCVAGESEKNQPIGRPENSPQLRAYNAVLALAKHWRETDKAWYVKEKFMIAQANRVQSQYSPDLWVEKMNEAYSNSSTMLDIYATTAAYDAAMNSKDIVIYDWMMDSLKGKGIDKERLNEYLIAKPGEDLLLRTVKNLAVFFTGIGVEPGKAEQALIGACAAAREFIRHPTYWQCRRQVVTSIFPVTSGITQQFFIDAEMLAYRRERGEITKEEESALLDRLILTAEKEQQDVDNETADRQFMAQQLIRAMQPRQPSTGEVFFESLSRSFNRREQQAPPRPTTCESYVVAGQLRTTCR